MNSGLNNNDMERRNILVEHDSIMAGYRDVAAGRTFPSTGGFQADMKILASKEMAGWP